jgi:hypothetical protein
MTLFFTILRAVRMTYKAVRAAIGIALVAHGSYVWVKNKRAAKAA